MTIQIKRGSSASRPNPLLNGEFGWDSDTKRLWIGNGAANENLLVAGAAVTSDFSVYVCTTALGGGAADADGLAKNSGTATATTANKLVDSAASFDSSYVNKTVYNKTDDTWAKITVVDSATQLSLSADIMAVGEDYETTNAFATVPLGFSAVPGPYSANVTLRISPGIFSDAVTFIGKIAAGSKTLTVAGSATGTTTITGAVEISQKITVNNISFSDTTINANYGAELTWANCPLANVRLNTRNGSDLTWDNCDGSGTTRLYTYIGSKNLIENTAITVGNNPENLTSINSTITKGYTMYVATTALGGNDAVADGLAITSGSATSTSANKLVDSGANFTSALVGKTVYNSTYDTWAKVDAVDSATQLSLSADIMVSGEAYVISNAFSTIQGAVNAVPGLVNCDTTIKISNGTFTEDVVAQGKAFSGAFRITLAGTKTILESLTAASGVKGTGATRGSVTRNAGTWTTDQRQHKLLKFTSGNNSGVSRIIDTNDTTVATITGQWDGTIASGNTFVVQDWATIIQANVGRALTLIGQTSFYLEDLALYKQGTSWAIDMFTNSSLTLTRCYMQGYACQEPGTLYTYDVIFTGDTMGVFLQQASYFGYRTKITGYSYCLRALAMSNVQIREGCIINAGSVYGVWIDRNSVGRFDTPAGTAYNFITNNGTGIYAGFGGMGRFTSTVQYSGNTTNESADAATYGYID